MTKSQLFTRAHAIAKTLEGDYRARFSYALTIAWKEFKGADKKMEEIKTFNEMLEYGLKGNVVDFRHFENEIQYKNFVEFLKANNYSFEQYGNRGERLYIVSKLKTVDKVIKETGFYSYTLEHNDNDITKSLLLNIDEDDEEDEGPDIFNISKELKKIGYVMERIDTYNFDITKMEG